MQNYAVKSNQLNDPKRERPLDRAPFSAFTQSIPGTRPKYRRLIGTPPWLRRCVGMLTFDPVFVAVSTWTTSSPCIFVTSGCTTSAESRALLSRGSMVSSSRR